MFNMVDDCSHEQQRLADSKRANENAHEQYELKNDEIKARRKASKEQVVAAKQAKQAALPAVDAHLKRVQDVQHAIESKLTAEEEVRQKASDKSKAVKGKLQEIMQEQSNIEQGSRSSINMLKRKVSELRQQASELEQQKQSVAKRMAEYSLAAKHAESRVDQYQTDEKNQARYLEDCRTEEEKMLKEELRTAKKDETAAVKQLLKTRHALHAHKARLQQAKMAGQRHSSKVHMQAEHKNQKLELKIKQEVAQTKTLQEQYSDAASKAKEAGEFAREAETNAMKAKANADAEADNRRMKLEIEEESLESAKQRKSDIHHQLGESNRVALEEERAVATDKSSLEKVQMQLVKVQMQLKQAENKAVQAQKLVVAPSQSDKAKLEAAQKLVQQSLKHVQAQKLVAQNQAAELVQSGDELNHEHSTLHEATVQLSNAQDKAEELTGALNEWKRKEADLKDSSTSAEKRAAREEQQRDAINRRIASESDNTANTKQALIAKKTSVKQQLKLAQIALAEAQKRQVMLEAQVAEEATSKANAQRVIT